MQATSLSADHKKGLIIATIGGLLLAVDIPLVRLAETNAWTTLVIRGPIVALVLAIAWYFFTRFNISKAKLIDGRDTFVLGALHTTATFGFVLGIFNTTTANLVFITALSSLVAIVFSTVILKERHPFITWLTVFVALIGIAIITIGDLIVEGGKNTFGNLMALMCAVMLAAEVVFIRRSGKNLVYAPAIAALMAAIIALPLMLSVGYELAKPSYLILDALIVAPVTMGLLTLAPRYISAPETTMFYLLETVFAPVLVWAIFHETPTSNALLGGIIVILAILFHSVARWRQHDTLVTPRP